MVEIIDNLFDSLATEYKNTSQETGIFVFVGEPGIEPGPHGPKPRTLPLCYTPNESCKLLLTPR